MDFDALLTLSENGKVFANPRRIALLKAIQQTGSISQGAKQAGISYKAAYDAIKDMNKRADTPLIASEKGGKGGGGAALTEFGSRLVQMYDLLDTIQNMGLKALNDPDAPLHSLLGVMTKFSLQTSARNQLFGTISHIERHSLHDKVWIALKSGQQLCATITHGSTQRLELAPEKDVIALIKGPAIHIRPQAPNEAINIEPVWDNCLQGVVSAVQQDGGTAEVLLKLDEQDEICALIDYSLEDNQPLATDQPAMAYFASTQVIIATLC
ncbi:TOBE domain-containing protein [Photobacterium atrarenae]|uniref:TOBE domain-containing protein n=1 Tax=Photobacterium atrarenae TaxID=865757 RepID=A0ABY5GMF2_9GAMM|nr:TOBE domain-containing protein [Photobacterium atrarenae]UTV29889.1 TOBE domain-containing protein [Photobacterium atrarenae]